MTGVRPAEGERRRLPAAPIFGFEGRSAGSMRWGRRHPQVERNKALSQRRVCCLPGQVWLRVRLSLCPAGPQLQCKALGRPGLDGTQI